MSSVNAAVERRLGVLLALALGALGAITLVTILTVRGFMAEAEWVAHSHVVIERLETILAITARREAAERGYLLTGDPRFLVFQPLDDAALAATLTEVRVLTADDWLQQRRLTRLTRRVLQRGVQQQHVRAIRDREGMEAAIGLVREGAGRRLTTAMRRDVERMVRVERDLLAVRSSAVRERATAVRIAVPVASFLAFLVIAGVVVWIRRDFRRGETAVRELHSVSKRLDLALRAGKIGTWTFDVARDELVWDRYMYPLFGIAPTAFGGHAADFADLVHPDDRAIFGAALEDALATSRELVTEYRIRWPEGATRVLATRGQAFRDARGVVAGVAGVCWDVTDEHEARAALRRLKEAADAASEAKSEFLTSMSHELRTPMNSIIGFSQLVLRSKHSQLADDDVDALQTVQRNAKHLLVLINQVLDLARVEAGTLRLARARLDLGALVADVVEETRPLVLEKPVAVTTEKPAEPLVIDADETRVRQIVMNLVANALKYTSEGAVTVRVAEHEDPDLGPVATVAITDTGPGIAPADRAKLFHRFSRLDTDATAREGGAGLGLSLSQELARMHGGHIGVESDGRSGSTFTLTLPIGWRRPRALAGVAADEPMSALTILCVDHDPEVLALLQRSLQAAGYRVLLASSCEEAVSQAEASPPDLVCLELELPDGDAGSCVSALRRAPATAHVPVIVAARREDEARAVVAGARRLVLTPVDPEALVATVREVLQESVATVLIADDDPDARTVVRATLEQQGLEVFVAGDGAEALRRLREVSPDVVVLDLSMPVMDGFEVVRRLQASPARRDLPVVILSGQDLDRETSGRLAATGAVVLTKGRADAVALVRAVTGGRSGTRAQGAPSADPILATPPPAL